MTLAQNIQSELNRSADNSVSFRCQTFSVTFTVGEANITSVNTTATDSPLYKSSGGFFVETSQSKIPLVCLTGTSDSLVFASQDGSYRVEINVAAGEKYLAFRLISLHGFENRSDRVVLAFDLPYPRQGFSAWGLDYMTEVFNDHRTLVSWPAISCLKTQSANQAGVSDPLGAFALFRADNPDEADQIMLHIWGEQETRFPKTADGKWSYDQAKEWLDRWQKTFSDRSRGNISVDNFKAPGAIDALKKMVDRMKEADIRQIYLFTDVWREGFWQSKALNWGVNTDLFKNGEPDFQDFARYVRSKGLLLTTHYLSGTIGFHDPRYVENSADSRLAFWVEGTLRGELTENDSTAFQFRPDESFRPALIPESLSNDQPKSMGYYTNVPGFFHGNHFRIGGEIVTVKSIQKQPSGDWLVQIESRNRNAATERTHKNGTSVAGLFVPYGCAYVPDNASSMLDEIAREYANFVNRNQISHIEYDGLEIDCYELPGYRYGWNKFSALIYKHLDHPITTGGSAGVPAQASLEYRFNSTKRMITESIGDHNDGKASIVLESLARPATNLLDANFMLSQMAARVACNFSILKPEPMFGLTPDTLQQHGQTNQTIALLSQWKRCSALLSDSQRQTLRDSFNHNAANYPNPLRHWASDTVYVLTENPDAFTLTPTTVLTREKGDTLWTLAQEHGPVSPRQYVQKNQTVTLINKQSAQQPSIYLRVLPQTDPDSPENYRVQPTVEQLKFDYPNINPDEQTEYSQAGNALRLKTSNPTDKKRVNITHHASWTMPQRDLSNHRAVGMTITGDGTGAVLVFQCRGMDYIVPIDFTGKKYVEIPLPQAAWFTSDWSYRMDTKKPDFQNIGRFSLGFGTVPPKTQTEILVEDIRFLKQQNAELVNPEIRLDENSALRIQGTLRTGEQLVFDTSQSPANSVSVYDGNWNRLRTIPAEIVGSFLAPQNQPVCISLRSKDKTSDGCWLEIRLTTTGSPITIPKNSYSPRTFVGEDPSILSFEQVWADKTTPILNDDLDETVLEKWTENGCVYKRSFFTSRIVPENWGAPGDGGTIRLYALYGAPDTKQRVPGILHIHGGGQTANPDWVKQWAQRGYAVVSIDWGGCWTDKPERKFYAQYPPTLKYCNQQTANHNSDQGRTETNCWYEWTYACRRALTFLTAQEQTDPNHLGVFGISMGGTLTWMAAAADKRVTAAVPIYGAGFEYQYRNYNQPETGTGSPKDPNLYQPTLTAKRYLSAITCEAVASRISAPLLFLNATNDQHGNMDFSSLTLAAVPVDTVRRVSYAPNFIHHIAKIQENDLPIWFDVFLRHKPNGIPQAPTISLACAPSGKPEAVLRIDSKTQHVKNVRIYYALENTNAFARNWVEIQAVRCPSASNPVAEYNEYRAEIDVMNLDKPLFVYASVLYENGFHLSTSPVFAIPEKLGASTAGASPRSIIYDASEGLNGWATQSIGTDPIAPVPLALETGSNGRGVVAAGKHFHLITYRLTDPRLTPKSPQARLRFTFQAQTESPVTIYLQSPTYGKNRTIYQHEGIVNPSAPTIEFGLSNLTPSDGGPRLDNWSDCPIIRLFNPSQAVLQRIEQITSDE